MPTMRTVYRANGETLEMNSTDAQTTVARHPSEYSFTPFSAADQAVAKTQLKPTPALPSHLRPREWNIGHGH